MEFKMRNYSKFNFTPAFTLAEVLVTLGIIGVVSAMTVPTLMQNHQRKVFVTQLHKVYNEFQQAATAQIAERNAINLMEAGVRSDAAMRTFLKNQFNVVKDCTGTPSNCLASSYLNMNGGAVTSYSNTSAPCFLLASGAAVCASYNVSRNIPIPVKVSKPGTASNGDIYQNNYIEGLIGYLTIDTNGKSGPNIVGRDLFVAGIYSNGSVDSSLPGTYYRQQITGGNSGSSSGGNGILVGGGSVVDKELDDLNGGSNLEKCKKATTMVGQSDASYCFEEILSNNWEMDY